jgi:hypothetical protein
MSVLVNCADWEFCLGLFCVWRRILAVEFRLLEIAGGLIFAKKKIQRVDFCSLDQLSHQIGLISALFLCRVPPSVPRGVKSYEALAGLSRNSSTNPGKLWKVPF